MKIRRVAPTRGGMPKIKATNSNRAVYNDLLAKYQGDSNVIITPSFLRLERTVSGSLSALDFYTLQTEGNIICTERRLQLPDTFVVTGIGMYISKVTSDTAALQAKKIYRSFPNPQVFTGSGEADNLQSLYNGYLSLRINSTVIIDSLPCLDFYAANQSQQGVGSSATSNVPIQRDQLEGSTTGYLPINPTVNLDGSKKIQWSLTLPNSTDLSGTSSTNVVALSLKGFLVQNGGNVSQR